MAGGVVEQNTPSCHNLHGLQVEIAFAIEVLLVTYSMFQPLYRSLPHRSDKTYPDSRNSFDMSGPKSNLILLFKK
jgi:hypothetical protein